MKPLELKVYEIFKNKLGQQEAEAIIEYFEAAADKKYEEKKDILATKEDIGQLRKEVAETKADIIKWSFVFWVGTVITVLGGLFAILKLFFNK
ncbi:MAG TPA: hypothetical protein VNS58_17395 [Puia sp.]|jgi:hypothetical protein|nr:hypothetical protein [Puia sp.]